MFCAVLCLAILLQYIGLKFELVSYAVARFTWSPQSDFNLGECFIYWPKAGIKSGPFTRCIGQAKETVLGHMRMSNINSLCCLVLRR